MKKFALAALAVALSAGAAYAENPPVGPAACNGCSGRLSFFLAKRWSS